MENIIKDSKQNILKILKQPILYILIFCVIIQIQIYKTIPDYVITNDSTTYTEYYNGSIRKGQVDALRTPVYPYIAKIIGKIGGQENLYQNIVVFQKILFVITVIIFYYTIYKITNNKLISSLFTIVFGICPFIIFWNIMILTESIALFELALLSFITIKYLKAPSKFLAGTLRNTYINNDNDQATIYIFIAYIFIILDIKIFYG